MSKILVAGGAGFIGSHTCVELLAAGFEIVVVDDLSNSHFEVIQRVQNISGKSLEFQQVNICHFKDLEEVFQAHHFAAVIHFAGYKAVGESVTKPLEYYENNLVSTFNLCRCMRKYQCKVMIFSSSATVYGEPESCPLLEDFPTSGTNPYGWTKWMNERILEDLAFVDKDLSIILLRYFNPIGAHQSGQLGEDPQGIPNNLMPYISQVAIGKLEKLHVFGNDYDTIDGTGVRDYIHVVDLAKGHVKALIYALENSGLEIINLGTGQGYSVLQLVEAFEKVNEVNIPYVIDGRRAGDIAECYADVTKAKSLLQWETALSLNDMCRDSWKWQTNNPSGYQ